MLFFSFLLITLFPLLSFSLTAQEIHQLEINYLNKLTSTFNNITIKTTQKYQTNPSLHSVCVSTRIHTYGGLGNYIGTLITATVLSFLYERVLVINNNVITSMFKHPNEKDTFKSFIVTPSTPMVSPGECQIMGPAASQTNKLIGVNRCNQALVHDMTVQKWFSQTLNVPITYKLTNKDWLISENRISYDVLHWLLSKLTPEWEAYMKEHATNVFKNCSRDGWEHHRANLALQVRTFADVSKDPMSRKRLDCYLECAKQRAIELHKFHKHSVCILVTSDNSQLTDLIIHELSEIDYITAVHNDYPVDSTLSHSADLLLNERDNPNFSVENLKNHPEFVDWMLLSDSESAIYTKESTFAATARYRAGYIKSQHDKLVHMVNQNTCVCDPVVDPDQKINI